MDRACPNGNERNYLFGLLLLFNCTCCNIRPQRGQGGRGEKKTMTYSERGKERGREGEKEKERSDG